MQNFNFFSTFDIAHKLGVARNMHVRGEGFASFTFDSNGIISSITDVSLRDLVKAGIAEEQENGSYRCVSMMDDSADAQAAAWGDIAKTSLCSCSTEPEVEDWKRFERYDGHGEYTGSHGFACPTCKGIVQVG